jgi:hypothetical protein
VLNQLQPSSIQVLGQIDCDAERTTLNPASELFHNPFVFNLIEVNDCDDLRQLASSFISLSER